MSWAVDVDYVGQLSGEDKAWLGQFLDRHYGGDFRGPSEAEWSDDARRAAYRRKNSANRDLYAHDESSGEDPLRDQLVEVNMDDVKRKPGRPRKSPEAPTPDGVGDLPKSDAPEVAWLALHKTPKGWVVLSAKSQGNELADETILHGPMPHASARNFFRLEAERRYLRRPR